MSTPGIRRRAALCGAAVGLAGCGPSVVWYGKSPDRAIKVAVVADGDGQRVSVDGRDGPAFRGVGIEALSWSPDGRRLAYPARTADGWVVIVAEGDRHAPAGAAYDGLGEIAWSADSKHMAYAAERKARWLVVKDGREGATFEALRARSLRMSADGAHMAYAADEDGKVVVVTDGARSAPYEGVGHLALGPSGEAAFVARRKEGALVVVGGKESAEYEDVADLSVSPGGEVAWTARKDGHWHVVQGGVVLGREREREVVGGAVKGGAESEPYDRVSTLVRAPQTGMLAYAVGRGTEEWVIAGGEAGARFDGILPGSMTFDAGGKIIAYAGRRKGMWRVVAGEEESPPYEDVEPPVFVGDSAAVAHMARRGEATFVVVDGHQGPVGADASGLALSPDGRRFLYAAMAGSQMEVVMGEVRGGPCGEGRCTPVVTRTVREDVVVGGTAVWSPGGAHSAYLAGEARSRRFFLVIDGARAGTFDVGELMASLVVRPDMASALAGESRMLAEWVRAEAALVERRGRRGGERAGEVGSRGAEGAGPSPRRP